MTSLFDLTEDNFRSTVDDRAGITVVDFYADWCAPCVALEPVLDELAREVRDVAFARVDVSAQESLSTRFDVQSVPTVIIFRNGTPVSRLFGAKTKRQILRALDNARDADGPAPDSGVEPGRDG